MGRQEYRRNRGETAVMGTKSTVVPWRQGYVARGYRGDGANALGNNR